MQLVGYKRAPDGFDIIMTLKERTSSRFLDRWLRRKVKYRTFRVIGNCTVWRYMDTFESCGSWLESQLSDIHARIKYRESCMGEPMCPKCHIKCVGSMDDGVSIWTCPRCSYYERKEF